MWSLLPLSLALSYAIVRLTPALGVLIAHRGRNGPIGDAIEADPPEIPPFELNPAQMAEIEAQIAEMAPESGRITEMPLIFDPIDPMDGLIPVVDADWAQKLPTNDPADYLTQDDPDDVRSV